MASKSYRRGERGGGGLFGAEGGDECWLQWPDVRALERAMQAMPECVYEDRARRLYFVPQWHRACASCGMLHADALLAREARDAYEMHQPPEGTAPPEPGERLQLMAVAAFTPLNSGVAVGSKAAAPFSEGDSKAALSFDARAGTAQRAPLPRVYTAVVDSVAHHPYANRPLRTAAVRLAGAVLVFDGGGDYGGGGGNKTAIDDDRPVAKKG